MCFFITVLFFLEIWYTMTTIPKVLSSLVGDQKPMSLSGCLRQMYYLHPVGITERSVLTAMVIDRILSITLLSWLPNFVTSLFLVFLDIVWIANVCFCSSNEIQPTIYHFINVLSLASTDTSLVVIEDAIHVVETLVFFLVITLFYTWIFVVILGMPSSEGCHKDFSTSAAHLAVFLLFSG